MRGCVILIVLVVIIMSGGTTLPLAAGTHISLGVSVGDAMTYEFTRTRTILPNGTPVDYVLNYIVVENQNFPIPVEITAGSTMTIRIVNITREEITHEERYAWMLRNGSTLRPKPLNFTRSLNELVPMNSAFISTDINLITDFLERQKAEFAQNNPEYQLEYQVTKDILAINFTATDRFLQSVSSLYFEYDLITGWNTLARLVTSDDGNQLKSEIILEAKNGPASSLNVAGDINSLLEFRVSIMFDAMMLGLVALIAMKCHNHGRRSRNM